MKLLLNSSAYACASQCQPHSHFTEVYLTLATNSVGHIFTMQTAATVSTCDLEL